MNRCRDFDDFLSTYVKTNVSPRAKKYEGTFFDALMSELLSANHAQFSKLALHVVVSS